MNDQIVDTAKDVIVASDLVKTFPGRRPLTAVDSISLSVHTGKLTALVGPDGAGKTTVIRMVAGLLAPSSGSLSVLGIDVVEKPQEVQDRISYMPQRFGLYEDLSVMENMTLYADLHGVPEAYRRSNFKRLLAMTDMDRFTARPAGKLSGGMKQKLGLACTLVRSPELLLLDEPSVGVDPLSRRDLWRIIEQLVAEDSLSVLVSTSYLDEAERCDQVLIMHEGRILAQGHPEKLRKRAEGYACSVQPPQGMRARDVQARLLEDSEHIADAVPRGDAVRFIRMPGADQNRFDLPGGAAVMSRKAELEDAFMLILRKTQQEKAPLAEASVQQGSTSALAAQASRNEPVIMVRDLVRKFGDFTAVDSTNFSVQHGEIFGLLGPNGAGKTTTFRMLCGLLPATSGYLEVAGVNLRTARAKARGRIGYVSQKFALYGNLSVRDNLEFFGGAYGLYGKRLQQRIAVSLEQFSLDGHAQSGELPGGYKQRLAMASALLHEPEILFLDEPTSGIDPLARRSFWYTIGGLADHGTTIIVTTHFMEEAEYCDRIVIQDAGKTVALGTPAEVRAQAGEGSNQDMNSAFISIVEAKRSAAAAQPAGGAA
ncbi:ABC transporter ATP-binding protein [Desulfosarcina widdelii]|uniref:ABC transporter ATP-binding protein n=1 Tax=Desulfosarcina widdelii TaxID=947919 RepID=A0A5K7Z0T7_9BACT|nr:ATP-binding cassette domain-containing protein [Desulfosarcina widdelii]BBO73071.1 ABC transporter ATP-binding protein [Desulfosarcina widdelii]